MAGKNTAVFGIYSDRMRVEKAVDRLKADGFRNTDISVLLPENVLLLTVRTPAFPMAPALPPSALLPKNVLLLMFRVP